MRYQYVLVGGGLQNGLIALALLHKCPGSRLALVEKASALGGNHIWCFHAGDVPEDANPIMDPLVCYRWQGYKVLFPDLQRELEAPYAGISCERLDRVVRQRITEAEGCDLFLGATAVEVGTERVRLDDGREIAGDLVIDARGPERAQATAHSTGYQKFVGVELELHEPHQLTKPVLMDATVPQIDGFRFFYTLPLAPDRLLIEDTYFSDTPDLDRKRVAMEVFAYANTRGYAVKGPIRQESGVLPLPWDSSSEVCTTSPLVAGYQGGWFHPVTGYSLPVALKLARYVAETPIESIFDDGLRTLYRVRDKQLKYCYRLNKMMFHWFAAKDRYNVLERFYRLPLDTIRRFYALELTAGDRARILMGRPPKGISWRSALTGRSAV